MGTIDINWKMTWFMTDLMRVGLRPHNTHVPCWQTLASSDLSHPWHLVPPRNHQPLKHRYHSEHTGQTDDPNFRLPRSILGNQPSTVLNYHLSLAVCLFEAVWHSVLQGLMSSEVELVPGVWQVGTGQGCQQSPWVLWDVTPLLIKSSHWIKYLSI